MIYKYFSPNDHSLGNLRRNTMFFRHPSLFNDPFEFWAIHRTGIPQPVLERERFVEAMKAWGFVVAGSDWIPEEHVDYFAEVNDYQPDFGLLYRHARIACFCSDPVNLLMWSHYADGMRGFCAGYDSELLVQIRPECNLIDVNYCRAPPTVDSFVYAVAYDQYEYHMMAIEEERRSSSGSGMERLYREAADVALKQVHRIWQQAFASKPDQWAYEREKRLVVLAADEALWSELVPMREGTLTEIILGERMEAGYRERLVECVSGGAGDIPIREARRSRDKYGITVRQGRTGTCPGVVERSGDRPA